MAREGNHINYCSTMACKDKKVLQATEKSKSRVRVKVIVQGGRGRSTQQGKGWSIRCSRSIPRGTAGDKFAGRPTMRKAHRGSLQVKQPIINLVGVLAKKLVPGEGTSNNKERETARGRAQWNARKGRRTGRREETKRWESKIFH